MKYIRIPYEASHEAIYNSFKQREVQLLTELNKTRSSLRFYEAQIFASKVDTKKKNMQTKH